MIKKTALLLPSLLAAPSLEGKPARATLPYPFADALVAEAVRKNPDVVRALESAEAARQRISPARTLPEPFLSFNYQNDGTSFSLGEQDMTFLGAMFSQPLPWPGKLRLAGEEATQRAGEVRASLVGRAQLSVEASVRRAYTDYLLARELLDLIEDRSPRSQVEVLRLDEARADQTVQVAARRAEVNRLLARQLLRKGARHDSEALGSRNRGIRARPGDS